MQLTSPAFTHGGSIPVSYTCDGDDTNPPLVIVDVPTAAKSLVLVVTDPDAPGETWVHWTVWNIDPATKGIAENSIPAGAVQGQTSFGRSGYGGPCPPSGVHRYVFTLYALDLSLALPQSTTADQLEAAIVGHVVSKAELRGEYQRG